MIIDQNSIMGDTMVSHPDWCFQNSPSPPEQVKERIIILGGNASSNQYITGTADQREDK